MHFPEDRRRCCIHEVTTALLISRKNLIGSRITRPLNVVEDFKSMGVGLVVCGCAAGEGSLESTRES